MGIVHFDHAAHTGSVRQLYATAQEDTSSTRDSDLNLCWWDLSCCYWLYRIVSTEHIQAWAPA